MTRRTSRAEDPHLTCHARAVRQSGQATGYVARVWMAHAVASVHRLERVRADAGLPEPRARGGLSSGRRGVRVWTGASGGGGTGVAAADQLAVQQDGRGRGGQGGPRAIKVICQPAMPPVLITRGGLAAGAAGPYSPAGTGNVDVAAKAAEATAADANRPEMTVPRAMASRLRRVPAFGVASTGQGRR